MLGSCSKESIYNRFRFFFTWSTHEVATRYCYIDYDREMAIVSEVVEDGKRVLTGVGRLVADPDLETAEYAVLVSDRWQNRGLGGLLTDKCMEIAREWGIKLSMPRPRPTTPAWSICLRIGTSAWISKLADPWLMS